MVYQMNCYFVKGIIHSLENSSMPASTTYVELVAASVTLSIRFQQNLKCKALQ